MKPLMLLGAGLLTLLFLPLIVPAVFIIYLGHLAISAWEERDL